MSGTPRRERILRAAAREFAAHGLAGARVERIAAQAGVNKQLLFHYFGSKEGLHRATTASVLERFGPTAKAGGPPAERLKGIVAQIVAAIGEHPALLALLATGAPRPDDPASGAQVALAWRTRIATATGQALRDGQRTGYFRDDIDPEVVAEVALAAALGWAAADSSRMERDAEAFQAVLLKIVLDYCAWR